MEHQRERRVVGVRRVPLDRVVDICTSDSGPAFQARSIDVSGRGMHVRSTHLPALQAPLVLRFQEHGSEIIAEGEVAWRSEGSPGGEFGVRFTALDSGSVQALKALCHADAAPPPGEPLESEEHDTEPAPEAAAAVHLHIAGLSTPMRAEIKGTRQRRLEVTSPLEFLRVGRNLEVEELGAGGRREARIDAVDVAVDEVSRIPELIVSVRYADVVDTPLPAPSRAERVLSTEEVLERPRIEAQVDIEEPLAACASAFADADRDAGASADGGDAPNESSSASEAALERDDAESPYGADERDDAESPYGADERDDAESPYDADERDDAESLADERASDEPDAALSEAFDEDEGPSESERLRARLDGVWRGLSSAALVAGRQCQAAGHAASRGARELVSRARVAASARSRPRAPLPPRRTAAAPRAAFRNHPPRQQQRGYSGGKGAAVELEPAARRRRTRLIALGGLLASAALIAALVGRGGPAPESVSVAEPPAPPGTPVTSAPAPDGAGAAPDGEVPPVERTRPVILPGDGESEESDVGEARREMAQVPLFGPTSLSNQDAPKPAPPKQRALARVKVADQTFDSAPPTSRSKPRTSTEFSNGRLHLPIVYRLRLDQPGGSLRGERTPMGFDVVIVGRKTMESGAAISARDKRIAKVLTRNGPEGTRVSFRFKKNTPAYKVRLRKDFVEFFISSP